MVLGSFCADVGTLGLRGWHPLHSLPLDPPLGSNTARTGQYFPIRAVPQLFERPKAATVSNSVLLSDSLAGFTGEVFLPRMKETSDIMRAAVSRVICYLWMCPTALGRLVRKPVNSDPEVRFNRSVDFS